MSVKEITTPAVIVEVENGVNNELNKLRNSDLDRKAKAKALKGLKEDVELNQLMNMTHVQAFGSGIVEGVKIGCFCIGASVLVLGMIGVCLGEDITE